MNNCFVVETLKMILAFSLKWNNYLFVGLFSIIKREKGTRSLYVPKWKFEKWLRLNSSDLFLEDLF